MSAISGVILDYRQATSKEVYIIYGIEFPVSGYASIKDENGEIIEGIPIIDAPGAKKFKTLLECLENRLNHPENYTGENIEENIIEFEKGIHNYIQIGILLQSEFSTTTEEV